MHISANRDTEPFICGRPPSKKSKPSKFELSSYTMTPNFELACWNGLQNRAPGAASTPSFWPTAICSQSFLVSIDDATSYILNIAEQTCYCLFAAVIKSRFYTPIRKSKRLIISYVAQSEFVAKTYLASLSRWYLGLITLSICTYIGFPCPSWWMLEISRNNPVNACLCLFHAHIIQYYSATILPLWYLIR